jgi:hypothetical protein
MSYRNRSTIQSIIDEGKNLKIINRELSLKEIMVNSAGEKFVVNMYNLYEKYYELLLDHTARVVLSEEEQMRYRFNPRLLSKDLYGTIELHYMLLRLNHVYSVINFDFTEVIVFKPSVITLLNEIMVIESENFIENEVSIIKRLNE